MIKKSREHASALDGTRWKYEAADEDDNFIASEDDEPAEETAPPLVLSQGSDALVTLPPADQKQAFRIWIRYLANVITIHLFCFDFCLGADG